MKASRIVAIGLVVGAVAWVASGHLVPHESAESRAAIRADAGEPKAFRVAVAEVKVTPHSRKLTLSGRTEADKKVTITARTGGVLTEMRAKRGQHVKQGEIIAVLSDDAREAQVAQATALFNQRKSELEARRKLIEQGNMPRLEAMNLEAQFKSAEAALAQAVAERDRGVLRAPWDGIVFDTAEVGGAALSFTGAPVAQMVAIDPLLAVVEVSETRLAGLKVGDPAEVRLVNGQKVMGRLRYVAKTASPTTRTYRVEVELPNPNNAIPDGITAEVSIPMAPVPASRVPRSALTFSSSGDLGVRVVEGDKVGFFRVAPVEDDQSHMWVAGIPDGARVIVQGQDFVREGQQVIAVPVEVAVGSAR
ncbi:MAG: efflux RND transporter periplasmic adaptor subunit [Pseudorhodoplanes sp.]